MTRIQILVTLMSLLIAQTFSYKYDWNAPNVCPIGQFPQCPGSGSATTNPTWSTTPFAPSSSSSASSSTSDDGSTTADSTSTMQWTSWTSTMPWTSWMMNTTNEPPVCAECPRGSSHLGSTATYNNYYSNTNNGCQQCQQGFYANETGMLACKECPEGHQCNDPASSPQPCPRGFAYSAVWTDGEIWPQWNSGCRPCPKSTFSNRIASASCSPCPPGSNCENPTNVTLCPRGTSTEDNIYSYNSWYGQRCSVCKEGFYAPREGSASCTKCPEGLYCPDPTRALACPAGTYRSSTPNPIKFPRQKFHMQIHPSFCIRCPQGYYQTRTGSMTCLKCPRGFFCSDPAASPRACPMGTYSNSEYGQQQCHPCPDGTYTNRTASTTCIPCPAGSYCADQTLAPRLCPLGTYSNETFGQTTCKKCPFNTYANKTGSRSCMMCPIDMCCFNPALAPQRCMNSFNEHNSTNSQNQFTSVPTWTTRF